MYNWGMGSQLPMSEEELEQSKNIGIEVESDRIVSSESVPVNKESEAIFINSQAEARAEKKGMVGIVGIGLLVLLFASRK